METNIIFLIFFLYILDSDPVMEHYNALFDVVVIHAEEILLLLENLDPLDRPEESRCAMLCHSISIMKY